ncbi:MAG: DEAD/DEAH box helicase [Acidobacteriota bacterium]
MKTLASRCRHAFTIPVQTRGERYANRGHVRIIDTGPDHLSALVEGSSDAPYSVSIAWPDAENEGILDAFCNCPYAANHPCKHMWATVVLLDDLGHGEHIPGRDLLKVELHADPWSEEFAGRAPATPWRTHLAQVESAIEARRPTPAPRRRKLYLFLDDGVDDKNTRLVPISFFVRESRHDGTWGSIRPRRLDLESAEELDLDDRRLMEKLLGLPRIDRRGLETFRHGSVGEVNVAPMWLETLLPDLTAGGRFGWQVETEGSRSCKPLRFDDGEPFRLVLDGAVNGDGALRLLGSLERGGEARPVEDAKGYLETGLVFFEDEVARFDPESYPWIQLLQQEGAVELPKKEIQHGLEQLWDMPALPEVRLPKKVSWSIKTPEPQPRLTLGGLDGDVVHGRVSFAYDGMEITPDDARTVILVQPPGAAEEASDDAPAAAKKPAPAKGSYLVRRDRTEEERRLASMAPAPVNALGEVPMPAKDFVSWVERLAAEGWGIETLGRPLRAGGAFQAEVSSGMDWFDLTGFMHFGDARAELPALLEAARSEQRLVQLSDGSLGVLPQQWLARYGGLSEVAGTSDQGDGVRFSAHQALLLDSLLAGAEEVNVDEVFAGVREKVRSFERLEPMPTPEGFQGELRAYQQTGLAWLELLGDLGLGGCLADDMGLGKTIQVLALLWRRKQLKKDGDQPSLLIVPRSLMHNWRAEAERFTPDLKLVRYHGTDRRNLLEDVDDYDVLITTYGTMRRDVQMLRKIDFHLVVLDEAQAIKNARSQTAKAARLLNARHRLALTGTPVENHLGELWSIFEFLDPGMLGNLPSISEFAGKHHLPPEAVQSVAEALRPLILRRTKEQVLKDLPAKTEQTLICDLGAAERRRYDELRDHYRDLLSTKIESEGMGRSRAVVLEALLRLRQAACHGGLIDKRRRKQSSSKLDVLAYRLQEVLEEGDKALVFSQFTSFLGIVRKRLQKLGITYEYLDGRTRDRQAKVDRFQNDPDCPVFLISLKAGGVGLNLTAASYVFLLDPWWNPAIEAQAIDRTHRIGQEKPVFAYRLVARDTVEEKILELQKDKKALADAIVAHDKRFFKQLTNEDLQRLLG